MTLLLLLLIFRQPQRPTGPKLSYSLGALALGGVPSAISTTMMLVTNFFMPCRSKSIEVRSLSDSVITPRPYWKCLMYCPSGSAFNEAPKTDGACAKKRANRQKPARPSSTRGW